MKSRTPYIGKDVVYSSLRKEVKRKSYLLNNYALEALKKGSIHKIVYIPNNAYVADSLEVGTLPGCHPKITRVKFI